MKMFYVKISHVDPHVVLIGFHAADRAPTVEFSVKLATVELAHLVAKAIAKEHGWRKASAKRLWTPVRK